MAIGIVGRRGVTVPVAVGSVDCGRLQADRLPFIAHKQFLCTGLGISGVGKDLLCRLGFGALLAPEDLAHQGHHEVVADGRQPALRQFARLPPAQACQATRCRLDGRRSEGRRAGRR